MCYRLTRDRLMPTRTAEATWEGTLREGTGTVALGSGAYEGQYSFGSRFDDGAGTNPEELIGAAETSCFAMATAQALEDAGYEPREINAKADVHLERVEDDFAVTGIDLTVEGVVPSVDEETFRNQAEAAKADCPVSKAPAGTDVELSAELVAPPAEAGAGSGATEGSGEPERDADATHDTRGRRIKRLLDM